MKRAENCVDCKINHIRIEHDCLVFEFAKGKNTQDGDDHVGPWHVYANPENPAVCPVLALSRYLFTFPDHLAKNASLFEGSSQYERYSKIFHRACEEYKDDLALFGLKPEDLGTHSGRKGVSTMVAAGCTVSPPIISLCLRVGWTMGGVKERYLKHEKAGDQYVGRCATGLDQLKKEFGASPPYFDFSSIQSESEKVQAKSKIFNWLKRRLVNASDITPHTLDLLFFLFASLVYHKEFLEENLHMQCPLRASNFFKDIPDDFVQYSVVKYPWNKTSDTPVLTGIPPHVVILAQLEETKMQFQELKNSIKSDISSLLDEKLDGHLAGTETVHQRAILDSLEAMTKKIEELGTSVTIAQTRSENSVDGSSNQNDGSDVLNLVDEEAQVNVAMNEDELEGLNEIGDDNLVAQVRDIRERQRNTRARRIQGQRQLTMGFHNGRLQILLPTFKFPNMTMRQLVDNWFVGHCSGKVPPYVLLECNHVKHIKSKNGRSVGAIILRKMRHVMKSYHDHCATNGFIGLWPSSNEYNKPEVINRLWDASGQHYLEYLYEGCRRGALRRNEMTWTTIYNRMIKKKKAEQRNNRDDQSYASDSDLDEADLYD